MNKEQKNQLTGGSIFVSVGLLAVLVSLSVIAGPWWTLLVCGALITIMGIYTLGKVIK